MSDERGDTRGSTPDGDAIRVVDTRGMACPLPVLKARKALLGMAPGSRLRVVASDPMAAIDIPHFCAEAGHVLVSQAKSEGEFVFVIERGER